MCDADPDHRFTCNCQAPNCRSLVTGQDWQIPDLQKKYHGYFSPYLQRRIHRLQEGIEAGQPDTIRVYHGNELVKPATHYLSSRLAAQTLSSKGKFGIFAIQDIPVGELLTVWGGMVVTFDQLSKLETYQQYQAIQIEERFHLAPIGPSEEADYFNHSCNPNAGLSGQNCLVAMRAIKKGEEVCFDYATSDSTPYDEFICQCGEPTCRHAVLATDWMLPELWERYDGYFSPYLQEQINKLKKTR